MFSFIHTIALRVCPLVIIYSLVFLSFFFTGDRNLILQWKLSGARSDTPARLSVDKCFSEIQFAPTTYEGGPAESRTACENYLSSYICLTSDLDFRSVLYIIQDIGRSVCRPVSV